MGFEYYANELYHHGIKGQKWGIRRFQNEDGSLTKAGEDRYFSSNKRATKMLNRLDRNMVRNSIRSAEYEQKAFNTYNSKKQAKYLEKAKEYEKKVKRDKKTGDVISSKSVKNNKKVLASLTTRNVMSGKKRVTRMLGSGILSAGLAIVGNIGNNDAGAVAAAAAISAIGGMSVTAMWDAALGPKVVGAKYSVRDKT